MEYRFTIAVVGGLLSLVALSPSKSCAEVSLEWHPAIQSVQVGETVRLDLVAVSDSGDGPAIVAMDVVIVWPASALELLRASDDGPYEWLSSGFPPDADGLNVSWLDGSAKYTALARFDGLPVKINKQLHVTTMEFRALRHTIGSRVQIVSSLGEHARTVVFGGSTPGQNVTGQIAEVTVRAGAPADCDADGDVDTMDFARFQACFVGPVGPIDPPAYSINPSWCCGAFDWDGDGDVDLDDHGAFMAAVSGPNTNP